MEIEDGRGAFVLGIETSCDETAAAVVTKEGQVHSSVVASQVDEHAAYGGVVPELASRAHMRSIVPVCEQALRVAQVRLSDLEGIAVTSGPGLGGALLVGVQFAKSLAWTQQLPVVGVNHLEGHVLSGFLHKDPYDGTLSYPHVALLASGGHTGLYLVRCADDIRLLGQTRDDAAGEAFDKVAKMLDLPYPGGPVIERLALEGDPFAYAFPQPMRDRPGLEFSFSGLKTAVARAVGAGISQREKENICASFQRAVIEVLVKKSTSACRMYGARHLLLAGGVACNAALRTAAVAAGRLEGVQVAVPDREFCTDNAAMIAMVGALRLAYSKGDPGPLTVNTRAQLPRV